MTTLETSVSTGTSAHEDQNLLSMEGMVFGLLYDAIHISVTEHGVERTPLTSWMAHQPHQRHSPHGISCFRTYHPLAGCVAPGPSPSTTLPESVIEDGCRLKEAAQWKGDRAWPWSEAWVAQTQNKAIVSMGLLLRAPDSAV